MGAFTVSKNGFRMYAPSWQQNPGARMKQMNQSAMETTAALGADLMGSTATAGAGMAELAIRMATERIQKQVQEKTAALTSSLDTYA